MMRALVSTLLPVALVGGVVTSTCGEDFRVYTSIQDLMAAPKGRGERSQPPVIARSRTLFHATKVYDYIPEIDEVIVIDFKSDARNYSVLNPKRELKATIYFDEVKKKLQDALAAGDEAVKKMESNKHPRYRDAIQLYRFQRAPSFEEQFAEKERQLDLTSSLIHYKVQCATPPQAELVEAYCRYADAICMLNYVLHPGVLMPEPRLQLNQALREHSLLPTTVQLDVRQAQPVSLLATHQFAWQLDQSDRQSIDQWESMLSSPTTRSVKIQEYQDEVVRSLARARK